MRQFDHHRHQIWWVARDQRLEELTRAIETGKQNDRQTLHESKW
jgi:hypothetical protein